MKMGRKSSYLVHQFKKMGIQLVLSPVLALYFANQFTMQGYD
jgi:hypothetical protein